MALLIAAGESDAHASVLKNAFISADATMLPLWLLSMIGITDLTETDRANHHQ
jgi:hypothetical protein